MTKNTFTKSLKLFQYVNNAEFITILFLFTSVLGIYIHHLSPAVYGGDSGDFIAAALTRGVAHPSGYPLFTMLGILFVNLPIPMSPAWKFGLVSALISSISVVVFYLFIKELTKNRFISLISSLTLAFTYTFWLHAEIVEVMALNTLFILILLFLTVKYINSKNSKYLFYLAFFTGLALTNNQTIILIFPGILLTLLMSNKKLLTDIKLLVKGIGLFLLGLTPYLYIPLAARNNPAINWGKASTLTNFIALITRRDYGWVTSLSSEKIKFMDSLRTYFDYWHIYISILIPILIILGVTYLIIKRKFKFLVLFLLSFFLTGPLYFIYGNTPVTSFLTVGVFEKFYLSSITIAFILFPFGILLINDLIVKILKKEVLATRMQQLFLAVIILIPLTTFIANFPKTNFNNIYIGDNFARDILSGLPENSVALFMGDNIAFNSIYVQHAYGFRKDVYIPGIYEGFTQVLTATGLNENEIANHQINNRNLITRDIFLSAIGPLLSERDVFVDNEIEMTDNDYGKIVSIPYGLVYKLELEKNARKSKADYVNTVDKTFASFHLFEVRETNRIVYDNLIFADMRKLYSLAYFRVGEYIMKNYPDQKLAGKYIQKSIDLDPVSQ